MARAPLARAQLERPTDAPAAHEEFLPPDELPRHVAIIMDGNRRWARAQGKAELEGHAAGVEAIRGLLKHAVRRGVPVLTLYAFSRENWARSDDEVVGLFGLLESAIRSETEEPSAKASGSASWAASTSCPKRRAPRSRAPWRRPRAAKLLLNIAFNYAGRTELIDAIRRLIASGVVPETIDEAVVGGALYTAGLPDPDLLVRTGGEQRISNFLIWQSAYAEFYVTETLWPDFGPDAFDEALLEFARRQRRFGR